MEFPNFLLNSDCSEMTKHKLGQGVPLWISVVRIGNSLTSELGTQKGFSFSKCQM